VEIFVVHDLHNVVDVRFQADTIVKQVSPLAEPGQSRRVDIVSGLPQTSPDT